MRAPLFLPLQMHRVMIQFILCRYHYSGQIITYTANRCTTMLDIGVFVTQKSGSLYKHDILQHATEAFGCWPCRYRRQALARENSGQKLYERVCHAGEM